MSALRPLTVNEAIEKLTQLRDDGKGERMIVFSDHIDDDYKTLHGFEKALVKFESLKPHYPLNQTQTFYGQRAMRREKGCTPVVRIY